MKLRFLLCLCIVGALAQNDYDEDDAVNMIIIILSIIILLLFDNIRIPVCFLSHFLL